MIGRSAGPRGLRGFASRTSNSLQPAIRLAIAAFRYALSLMQTRKLEHGRLREVAPPQAMGDHYRRQPMGLRPTPPSSPVREGAPGQPPLQDTSS